MKILTAADGFGDSVAGPAWYPDFWKWPRILGLMTKGLEILDLCRYGAGNEYLSWNVRQNHHDADLLLIQWAIPNRLDLVLEHRDPVAQKWHEKIVCDPIYHSNTQEVGHNRWWLSSGSTVDWVEQYHSCMISQRQHEIRSTVWIEYTHRLLRDRSHGFLLTADSEYLQEADVDVDTWIWHDAWKGMDDWRHHSKYSDLDLGLTQPIPLIHFDFIKCFIMPRFDLPWRSVREIDAVESMLLRKYNDCKDQKPK